MCGIAGIFSVSGAEPDISLVKGMCDRMTHRGPDGEGYYQGSGMVLGHRRLSIIDLNTGEQPMSNEDGSIQVVFNGEIYNYRELRDDLVKRGHRFLTQSDTEVLVHLYEDVGDRIPEYLNGMFAFAIWDGRDRSLFLARDRAGEKPLYYSESVPGFRLCFASELKALAGLPGADKDMDPTALADYLAFGYVPDPATIYRSIKKLPAAHTLRVNAHCVHQNRYWRPFAEGPAQESFESATSALDELLRDSVSGQMMSDVPLGAFLSGGVDSSAVVSYMAEATPIPIQTFTIGFDHREFDETYYAKLTSQRYRTQHSERIVSPSIRDCMGVLAKQYDEPFADSSAIPMLYLSSLARSQVTVALSGDGADEIFGGYRRYAFAVAEERFRSRLPAKLGPRLFRFAGRMYPKFDYLPQRFRAKTTLMNLGQGLADAYYTTMSAFRDEDLERVLAPEMRARCGGYCPRANFRDRFLAFRHLEPLQQLQAVDFETYLPGDILVKVDRATMAYSLESRSPFLDHRLITMASHLPSSFKIQGREGKRVFKAAVSKRLPLEIMRRKKMGFSVPLASWFRNGLKPDFEWMLNQGAWTEYLAAGEVRRLWAEHQSGLWDHSRRLWIVMMLGTWSLFHREGSDMGCLPMFNNK
jgi:asparagine synthase (glutamine-hydrolysing)